MPDLRGDRSAEHLRDALHAEHGARVPRIAHPYRGGLLGHVAHEPRVLEVLVGSRLASLGPVQLAVGRSCAVPDDPLQHVRDLVRDVRGDGLVALLLGVVLIDEAAVRPGDPADRVVRAVHAAVVDGRIGGGHVER